jgi:hypothetical protein
LKATQEALQDHINSSGESSPDPEFTKAVEENTVVMYAQFSVAGLLELTRTSGSQEERIDILRAALSLRGIPLSAHYNMSGLPQKQKQSTATAASGESEDGGIDL